LDRQYGSALNAERDGKCRPLSFTQIAFEQAVRHIDWHCLDNASGSPIAVVRDVAAEVLRRELYGTGQRGSNIAIDCFSGALDFVVRRWLDGGAREEPRQMSKAFREYMTTVWYRPALSQSKE